MLLISQGPRYQRCLLYGDVQLSEFTFWPLSQVSLAAQRRWMESVAAAAAASSDDSSDSITSIKEEREEERLYRQVQFFSERLLSWRASST